MEKAILSKLFIILLLVANVASAHIDPHNAPLHAQHNDWLNRQYALDGMKCCDPTDVEVLIDPRWRIVNNRYEVFFNDAWHEVPPGRLLRPNPDDPSPYGEALLFRSTVGNIWCFQPAQLF